MQTSAGEYNLHSPSYEEGLKRQEEKLGRFKLGQIVTVKRGSGAMENSWHISGYSERLDKIVVMPNYGDPMETTLQKAVAIADLEKWNPE
jgi:hypothetical protein